MHAYLAASRVDSLDTKIERASDIDSDRYYGLKIEGSIVRVPESYNRMI